MSIYRTWKLLREPATVTVFWKSFAWISAPIVTLSIVSTAGALYGVTGVKFWVGFYWVWYVAASLWLVATITMVALYAKSKRENAKGVLAGIVVGAVTVGITGGVNFATIVVTFQ